MHPTLSTTPLSERVVDYQIDAHYDARQKSLDAVETLTYRNLTGQPLDTFPFHLYLNGFQPNSTFMREVHRNRASFEWNEKYRASATINSLEVAGMGDLTSQIKFVAPDDGNTDDRTVKDFCANRPETRKNVGIRSAPNAVVAAAHPAPVNP